jgi:hypothetical protein
MSIWEKLLRDAGDGEMEEERPKNFNCISFLLSIL